jgi:predicted phage terminase large subunit-like protein
MHRLAENDLSGHVLQSGDWRHIALPFIAPQDKVYRSDQRAWVRHRGDLLRPKAFSVAEIARIKQIINPDFEALYQQFLGETAAIKLSGDQFGSFVIAPGGPVVISVDPGHRAGPGHSFTVMQAWQRDGDNFLVLDQWRQQSGLDQAIKALRVGLARSRASAVLIEQTGYGEALARGLKRMAGSSDIRLVPTGQDSKTVRLLRHIEVIAAGRIKLPAAAEWREAWVNEFEQFPRGSSDDQVDALTQFLDFLANGPILRPPRQSCVAGTVNGRGVFTTGEEWTRRLGPGNVAFVKGAHRGRIFPPA